MALQRLDTHPAYRAAGDRPDLMDYRLLDTAGDPAGSLAGLLVDTDSHEIRYAIADLGTRQVLVPFSALDVDEAARRVALRGYTRARLEQLRPFRDADWMGPEAGSAEHAHYHEHVTDQVEGGAPDYTRRPFAELVGALARYQAWWREAIKADRAERREQGRELTFSASEPATLARPESERAPTADELNRENIDFAGRPPGVPDARGGVPSADVINHENLNFAEATPGSLSPTDEAQRSAFERLASPEAERRDEMTREDRTFKGRQPGVPLSPDLSVTTRRTGTGDTGAVFGGASPAEAAWLEHESLEGADVTSETPARDRRDLPED